MDLALTQGYTLGHNTSVGGVKAIYVIELENLGVMTAVANLVSAVNNKTAKRFWKYELTRATAEAEQDMQVSSENGTKHVIQNIKIVLNTVSNVVSNELKLLAGNRLAVVVEDRNGKGTLYGRENGLTVKTSKLKTGKASADRNGYELEMEGDENEYGYEIPASLLDDLLVPGT